MKKFILLTLMLVLVMPIGFANAQEPSSSNACFEGGLMAGKCTTEWDFICGYYLALWLNNGGWSAANATPFPDWCNPGSLLPARPVDAVAPNAITGLITCVAGVPPMLAWQTSIDPTNIYLQTVDGPNAGFDLLGSSGGGIGEAGISYNLRIGGIAGPILSSTTCP